MEGAKRMCVARTGVLRRPPAGGTAFSMEGWWRSAKMHHDRTPPGLPLKKGRCGTMTHDYQRNGTATLFAAMSTLDGTVISMCDDRHRHQEWLILSG
jgi:hypothetical protein